MKCQSLVRSRWIPNVKNEKGEWVPGYTKRLADPEACGESGVEYEVRKKARVNAAPKNKHIAFVGKFALPRGTMCLRQVFCDKHKRKAMREGNEVAPVDNTVESVQISQAG